MFCDCCWRRSSHRSSSTDRFSTDLTFMAGSRHRSPGLSGVCCPPLPPHTSHTTARCSQSPSTLGQAMQKQRATWRRIPATRRTRDKDRDLLLRADKLKRNYRGAKTACCCPGGNLRHQSPQPDRRDTSSKQQQRNKTPSQWQTRSPCSQEQGFCGTRLGLRADLLTKHLLHQLLPGLTSSRSSFILSSKS